MILLITLIGGHRDDYNTAYTNTGRAGQSVLVIGGELSIKKTAANKDSNFKQTGTTFNLNNSDRIVTYKLEPKLSVISETNHLDNATLLLTDTIPKELSYLNCISGHEPVAIEKNADGSTTLTWKILNCSTREPIPEIVYNCSISGLAKPGTYDSSVTISCDKTGDIDKVLRTSNCNIQIAVTKLQELSKFAVTPVVNTNTDLHYKITYANTNETSIDDFKLLDILPFNGDSRTTSNGETTFFDR